MSDPRIVVQFIGAKKRHLPELSLSAEDRRNGWSIEVTAIPHPDPKWTRHATVWRTRYIPPMFILLENIYEHYIKAQSESWYGKTRLFFKMVPQEEKFDGAFVPIPFVIT